MKSAAVAVMLVLHVATAIVGFGAVIATGVAARAARRSALAPSAKRYFRAGPNWASLSLLLVPVFGAALEALQKFPDLGEAWPWLALAMWGAAVAIGVIVHWPAERNIQVLVTAAASGEPDLGPSGAAGELMGGPAWDVAGAPPDLVGTPAELAGWCARAIWSSAAMAVLFVACVGLMVTQPH